MKIICSNCGKELSTEHDLYYDMKSRKMGCIYCMEGRMKEHVDWCNKYRKMLANKISKSYDTICQLSSETGYSFNDCKATLSEVNWDMNKARSELYGSYEVEEVEEPEQDTSDLPDAMRIIVRHILECAEELKQLGYNIEDL